MRMESGMAMTKLTIYTSILHDIPLFSGMFSNPAFTSQDPRAGPVKPARHSGYLL